MARRSATSEVRSPCYERFALGEARSEEVLELTASLTGEETALAITTEAEKVGDTIVRGVVKVGHAGEPCVSG